jgi:hypothetical protein
MAWSIMSAMRDASHSALPRSEVAWTPLLALALALFVLRTGVAWDGGYGWFIDELYYVSCARRAALGYVDHPPLSIWVLDLFTRDGQESLVALRMLAALFGSLTVVLTGVLAAELGARRSGQLLACVGVLTMPVGHTLFGFYSMNAIEQLLWTACLTCAVRMLARDDAKQWLWLGLLAGLGLLNKHTITLLAGAFVLALALTPARTRLRDRNMWLGAGIALALLLPNIYWQVQHGWPSLEFYAGQHDKNIPTGPAQVLFDQVLVGNPLALPIWAAGLLMLLRTPRWRPLGLLALMLLGFMMVMQLSRPDRISGMYPMLFAAGGAALDRHLRGTAARALVLALALIGGSVLAPIGLPILSAERMAAYTAALGVVPKIEAGEGKLSELPQWYADRHGWPEQAAVLHEVAAALTDEERAHAVVLAPSYGHAGAVERFGPALPVISPHVSWALWSDELLRTREFELVIAIGYGPAQLEPAFASVEQVAVLTCAWCPRWRRDMPIFIARQHRGLPLRELVRELGER